MITKETEVTHLASTYGVPERIADSLKHYVVDRRPTGDMLFAVLSNDLFEAFARADDEVIFCMQGIVRLVYNELPSQAWRNKETVQKWLQDDKQ